MVESNGESVSSLLGSFIFCSPNLFVDEHLEVLVYFASAIKSVDESHIIHVQAFDVLPHCQEPRAFEPFVFF